MKSIDNFSDKFIVGTVANISRVKNLENFIKSASLINDSMPNALFVVVGPVFKNQKKYYDTLKSLIKSLGLKNIIFTGESDDVRPLLKCFDIYVCSSSNESSPISVWEAMAMGKPIVSTNVGDVPHFVENYHNGFIVDVDDYESLSRKVLYLANNKETCELYGNRSRSIVCSKLNVTNCVVSHEKFFRTVCLT